MTKIIRVVNYCNSFEFEFLSLAIVSFVQGEKTCVYAL